MSTTRRPRLLIALSILGLAALAAEVVIGASIIRIVSSSRADVASETLAAIEFDQLGPHFESGWSEVFNHFDGEAYLRMWNSNNGERLKVEVWRRGDPIRAEWVFRSYNQKINYKSDFPGLVQDVALPQGINADSADLFCGNVGRSQTDELEDCQIWGYWARYGQYVLYLDLYGEPMPATEFKEAVASFDDHVEAILE